MLIFSRRNNSKHRRNDKMKKKEWQEFHGFTDEEVRKFDVFVPKGKFISIEEIIVDKSKQPAILVCRKDK